MENEKNFIQITEKIERTAEKSCNNTGGFLTSSLMITVVLLTLREFYPKLGEQFSAVYQFIDCYELPIINWAYKLLIKAISWLISFPMIDSVIQWLNNLAM